MYKKSDRALLKTPFVRIIIPAVTGIAAASFIPLPATYALVCFLIIFVSAVVFNGKGSGIYTWLSIAFFFFTAAMFNKPVTKLPVGERVAVVAQVLEKPTVKGRWMNATAHIGYCRQVPNVRKASGEAEVDDAEHSGKWERVDEKINLAIDTCYGEVSAGMQVAFKGWVNPVDTVGTSYGQLMRSRGIHNKIYLVPGNMLHRTGYVSRTPRYYSAVAQAGAVSKIYELNMEPEDLAVVAAMTVGDKKGLEPELRKEYNSSGAAHLLAVSGLHVGIVFVLINIVLYLLPVLVPRGHIWKNIIAVALIWCYAFVSGFSPSVIRAALMFSFAQTALASGSVRNALNIILGSAVIMLAVNPNYLYDPSFLLSYTAVILIISFFNPVFGLFKTKYKFLNAVLSVVIIGFVVSVGVAPLVSYFFGRVSMAGIIVNPLVIVTAHIIVMGGVLWLIMPFGAGVSVFSWGLDNAVSLQNAMVGWSARQEWLAFDGKMPLWSILVFYAVLAAGAVVLSLYNDKKVKSLSLHE